jgi:hypothetical protein
MRSRLGSNEKTSTPPAIPLRRWLSTCGFLDKVDENLKKAMAA